MTGPTQVWMSHTTSDARLTKPIRIMPENRDEFDMKQPELDHWAAVASDYRSSLIEDVSRLPKYLCGRKLDTKLRRLPDFFFGAGVYIVSQKLADIFRQFDLGHGGCAPVTIFQGDRRTQISESQFYILYFGCCKPAFSQELSHMPAFSRNMYIRKGQKGYNALEVGDDDCVVSALALKGPDLWIDASVGSAFFMSARLVAAIKGAAPSGTMFLKSCRVADAA
jgi:hypothetical protein